MRGLLLIALIAVALQHPTPYPEGSFCTPRGTVADGVLVAPDHPCHCRRVDLDPTCEGPPQEDPICRQFCSKEHCACPVHCAPPDEVAPHEE